MLFYSASPPPIVDIDRPADPTPIVDPEPDPDRCRALTRPSRASSALGIPRRSANRSPRGRSSRRYPDCGQFELDDAGEPDTWDDRTDERWTVTSLEASDAYGELDARAHLDRTATMGLVDQLAHVAGFFLSWSNPYGNLLARLVDEALLKARMTDATTPAEFEARVELLEQEVRDGWFQSGRESLHSIDDPAVRRGEPSPHAAAGDLFTAYLPR